MFPKYVDIELPLLRELVRRGGACAPGDLDSKGRSVYEALADWFGLSQAEREELKPTDGEGRTKWPNMVRFARQRLLERGILIGPHPGIWEVSDDGVAFLKSEAASQSEPASSAYGAIFPDEVVATADLTEGAVRLVRVNAYERNPEARSLCIRHFGAKCSVCGMSFGDVYGKVAEVLIHVHHLRPLSHNEGAYVVDPIKDLRPVCPNCHVVLHLRTPPYSIEEVKMFLARGDPV